MEADNIHSFRASREIYVGIKHNRKKGRAELIMEKKRITSSLILITAMRKLRLKSNENIVIDREKFFVDKDTVSTSLTSYQQQYEIHDSV
jgi:hypothetical protein